jgi:hypothetical protein
LSALRTHRTLLSRNMIIFMFLVLTAPFFLSPFAESPENKLDSIIILLIWYNTIISVTCLKTVFRHYLKRLRKATTPSVMTMHDYDFDYASHLYTNFIKREVHVMNKLSWIRFCFMSFQTLGVQLCGSGR